MTYEEHVARAMLLDMIFYPAYHGYVKPFTGKWIDADTLETFNFSSRSKFVMLAIHGDEAMPNMINDPKWFNWREWK